MISIEKSTNGVDADTPTGPLLVVGTTVDWTYLVTNTGDGGLESVVVTDDQGVTVSCPATTLAEGASMICTASGIVMAGQYANIGTTTAIAADGRDTDVGPASDPSHYFGIEQPSIAIEKATNGVDADTPPGPSINIGDPITWTYEVTNTGGGTLTNVSVTDDQGVTVSCPATTLAEGASMICTATGAATAGQYVNVGSVTADSEIGPVSDNDLSHYLGTTATPAPSITPPPTTTPAPTGAPVFTAGTPCDSTILTQPRLLPGLHVPTIIDIQATDPDPQQAVHLETIGLPGWAMFTSTPGNPAHGQLELTPGFLDWIFYLLLPDTEIGIVATDSSTPPLSAICVLGLEISLLAGKI